MRLRFLAIAALLAAACSPPQPTTLSHFASDGFSFDYPSSWNAATFDMSSSFQHWYVWLSTEPLADPCDRVSDSGMTRISCERSPVVGKVRPGGLLADWSSNGRPGWIFDSTAGNPVSVGVLRGTIEVTPADSGCVAIGGQTTVRVIVPMPTAPNNWMQFSGCVNEAFEGGIKAQVEAMLASAAWQ